MVRKSTVLMIGILTIIHLFLLTDILPFHYEKTTDRLLPIVPLATAADDPADSNRTCLLTQFGFTPDNSVRRALHSHTEYSADGAKRGALQGLKEESVRGR
jgi:hypothetical protein